jgi:hypothetical protein
MQGAVPLGQRTGRTEEVGDVEARRATVAKRVKIVLAVGILARVNDAALGEQDETVKEGDDVASRLMDRKDDGPVVLAGEGDERLDDVECVEGVEACPS